MVEARIKAYQEATGITLLDSDEYLSGGELVKAYFDVKPPFKPGDKQKYEFPDAIALLCLEAFAEEKATMMLCVSHDPDWVAYCGNSKHLCLVEALATALEFFQTPIDLAKNFLERPVQNDLAGLVEPIRQRLEKWRLGKEGVSTVRF